jgi:hypothetical protein
MKISPDTLEFTYNFNNLASCNTPNQYATPNMFYFNYLGPLTLLTKSLETLSLPSTVTWTFASVQNITVKGAGLKSVHWIISATDSSNQNTVATIGWYLNLNQKVYGQNVGSVTLPSITGRIAYATGFLKSFENGSIIQKLDLTTNQRVFILTKE